MNKAQAVAKARQNQMALRAAQAQAEKAAQKRDKAVEALQEAGATYAEIQEATGLSTARVTQILRRRRAEAGEAGQKLADEGAEAAAASFAMTGTEEGRQWTEAATAILDDLIGSGEPFTAEGITSRIGPAPSPTAVGSMFREASRLGRIRPVGWTKATRAAAHARPLRVWQGN